LVNKELGTRMVLCSLDFCSVSVVKSCVKSSPVFVMG
jgi:hypothetical protein